LVTEKLEKPPAGSPARSAAAGLIVDTAPHAAILKVCFN
jgi:hypothetical protein